MAATARAAHLGIPRFEFTMLPQGKATSVGWLMHGPLPLMGKVMHLFVNMGKMVGKDFESALANLKRLTEKQPINRSVRKGASDEDQSLLALRRQLRGSVQIL
jgi:hypothetical protein